MNFSLQLSSSLQELHFILCRCSTERLCFWILFCEGTSYPEINRRISQYVNRFHTFPDYGDIVEIIEKCNGKHGLGIRLLPNSVVLVFILTENVDSVVVSDVDILSFNFF